jgi:superfamily I DNA and/or RNA helicase
LILIFVYFQPGTGKTHTITGIISMLLSSDVKKILVCAPSNAAIDEIIARISVKGFIGEPDPNCLEADSILSEGSTADGMLLRLGSVEYDPGPDVRRHTLDARLVEVLNGNKA